MKKIILFFLGLMAANHVLAQDGAASADFMRSVGMIYVVVAVIALIFIGIVLYLWALDKRIKKMENIMEHEINHHIEGKEL